MTTATSPIALHDAPRASDRMPSRREAGWERDSSLGWMFAIPLTMISMLLMVAWIDSMTR